MKILSLIICMLLTTSGLAITSAEEGSILKENTISIVFSEPNIQKEDQFVTLNIKEATSNLMDPGKPVIPYFTKIFKFPFGTKIKGVDCKPLQITKEVISGEIKPSPVPVPLSSINNEGEKDVFDDSFVKDNSVYESNDFFPYSWYDYRVGCGLDDSSHVVFLRIQFYPVLYSPGQNMIKYANSVDIKVEYFEPIEPVIFPDDYDMVIISPSEFSEKLQPLVDYKNDSGVSTKLVTLNDIYDGVYFTATGRDEQEKIKYFIKDAIEEWGITNVLLAGGINKVPERRSYVQDGYETNLICDLYYADIYDSSDDFCSWDSNENDFFGEFNYEGRTDYVDLYPDVYIARLNFRSISEVDGVVNKIITYESTGAYMEDWFENFVVCGGDTFEDFDNLCEGEYLNTNAISMMDGFVPTKIWVTNGKLQFALNMDNAIENGTGFLYMTGHGTHITWATHPLNDFHTWWPIGAYKYSRVENLKNGDKLPVVIIGGCSNLKNAFDDCFGWSFIKNPDGGGIASYGNSALGFGYRGYGCINGLAGGMEQSAIKGYGDQNAKTTGELWSNAINNYLNDIGVVSAYGYKTVEEFTSFSDPSTRIRKVSDKPNKPEMPDGPTLGGVGLEYAYTCSATDPNGGNIKYLFDWGDGSSDWTGWFSSGQDVSLSHKWEKPDDYEIRVKARDQYGLDSEWSDPLLVEIVSQAPFFDIVKIKGGIGKVSATIANIGLLDAYDVDCNISVVGGLIGFINVFSQETFETLAVDEQKEMTAESIFGLGKISITVSASSPSANTTTQTVQGFVLGPLVFVFK